MVKVTFKYKDEYCYDGKFREQSCVVESVEKCIELYSLNDSHCEYEIISVEEVE